MELIFQKVTMEERELFDRILKNNGYRGCEWSLANLILWAEYYHKEYAIVNHTLVIRHGREDGRIRLTFPAGAESEQEERQVLEAEMEYFRAIGQEPWLEQIDTVMWEKLERWYPGRFRIEWCRDTADYIYEREKLTGLSGKKLHGKRNHIRRFQEQNPDWCYETLSEDNLQECQQMAKEWCRRNCCQADDEKTEEFHLVIQALKHYKELNMKGGLLRNQNGVIAFTLGCPISADTFDVCFEKAFSEIQGAYPMINQQFVLHELQGYRYINREEDLGIPGLRKAKLSYYPDILLEKGIVRLRNA